MKKDKNVFLDLCYSMSSFSGGIVSIVVGSWMTYYYVDKLGLGPRYYAIGMVIYSVWCAIDDPMMGIISDKTRSRWGRRKPYMLFGAIPLGLSLMLVFSPPRAFLETELGIFLFFIVSLCIYDTFFTMTMLTMSAALPDMYLDEKNRARVNVYAQIAGVLGGIIATLTVEPLVEAFNFSAMSIIFGAIGAITMFIGALGVREREVNAQGGSLSFVQSFIATFTNKAFVVCVLSVLMVELGKTVFQATVPFYSHYVLMTDFGTTIIMGIIFGSSIVFAPLVAMVCGKLGVRNTYILTTLVFSVASLGYFFAQNMVVACIASGIAGFGLSGLLMMPNMLYAQIIDDDQVRTGVRRDGTFFGMNALVMRLGLAAQGIIMSSIFSATGYVADADIQTSQAVFGIRSLLGIVPLAGAILAVLILLFYPINNARLREVQEKVRIMNQELEDVKE